MNPQRKAEPNPLRICFVGDSYVDGTGDPECLGWVGRVCQMAWRRDRQVTSYNIGIRGETSTMLARRWRAECEIRLPAASPALIVFLFGINDIAVQLGVGRRVDKQVSIENARRIVRDASCWKPTLWIGPPPANEACCPQSPMPGVSFDFRNDQLLELNAAFSAIAAEISVPFLDVATPLSTSAAYLKSQTEGDRMHCSADGYEEIARLVDAWPAWRAIVDRPG
jgi:lysophospholipase L1-like esterase